jgi:hypothetical protein
MRKLIKVVALAAVALLGGLVLAGAGSPTPEELEAAEYCRMVHLGQQTDGALGWPDYAGAYASQCTPEGRLRQ